MYCNHCGKSLPDDARFCADCGRPVFSPVKNGNDAAKTDTGWKRYLGQGKDIGQFLAPKKLIAVFVIIMAVIIGVWIVGKGDLSGTYRTTDFFPISQIGFDNSGHFSAVYCDGGYTETYEGKYQKHYNGQYSCRFTGGTSSSGNPVMEFVADNMDEQCELAARKVNEYTLEVWIVPKIGYWAWNGTRVYFYKD